MLARSAFSSVKIVWLREPRVNTLCGGHRANLHKSVAFSRRLKFLDAAFTLEVKNHEEQPFASLWIRCLSWESALEEWKRNESFLEIETSLARVTFNRRRRKGNKLKIDGTTSNLLLSNCVTFPADYKESGENSSADIDHLSLEINNFEVDLYNF